MTAPSTSRWPGAAPERGTAHPPDRAPRVAYVVSRYPRLTETFVAGEALAVVRAGADVHLHPLHRERTPLEQPSTRALASRVHHRPLLSASVLASLGRSLLRRPGATLGAAGSLVRHTVRRPRLLIGALATFPYAVDLARRLEADRVDHVHAHFATHPAAVAYVAHRLTGIPYSFTAHGSDIHRSQDMLAHKAAAAAFVVAVSESNRQVVLDAARRADVALDPDRVVVVHCGIDREQFPARPPRARSAGDPLRVTCVGTLHEVKGQTHVIDACDRARRAGVDVHLSLVGDGPDRPALQAQVEQAGLRDHVTFSGALDHRGVRTQLEHSDVLVVPSVPSADGRREGLPVVIVEAMATGVPVVASRLSGIPEIVRSGQTGLLVDPGDRNALAEALALLDREPGVADALAARAHVLVAAEFDAERSAARLVDLFAGALG